MRYIYIVMLLVICSCSSVQKKGDDGSLMIYFMPEKGSTHYYHARESAVVQFVDMQKHHHNRTSKIYSYIYRVDILETGINTRLKLFLDVVSGDLTNEDLKEKVLLLSKRKKEDIIITIDKYGIIAGIAGEENIAKRLIISELMPEDQKEVTKNDLSSKMIEKMAEQLGSVHIWKIIFMQFPKAGITPGKQWQFLQSDGFRAGFRDMENHFACQGEAARGKDVSITCSVLSVGFLSDTEKTESQKVEGQGFHSCAVEPSTGLVTSCSQQLLIKNRAGKQKISVDLVYTVYKTKLSDS